jgi:hypothetical protein
MNDRKEVFWEALGALTFVEMTEIAEVMRDAMESTTDFEATDIQDWSFLLNTASMIAEDRTADAA